MSPVSTGCAGKGPKPIPAARDEDPSKRVPPKTSRRRPRRYRRAGIPFTLNLYVAAEILRIFAVAVLAIAFVYITVIAFQLVREGIRLDFVWPHVLRTITYPLFFSIPLAFLFGITLGVGRMANDNELSALRAQGVSHWQLWTPLAILGLSLSGLTFYLTGWVLPEVHYEQANLKRTILDQLNHLGSGANRTILLPGDVSLWVRSYDGPHLKGIILDIQKGNRSQILSEIGAIAGEAVRRQLTGQLAGKVTLAAREADLEVASDRSRVILWLRGVEIQMPELVNGPRGVDVFHQMYTIRKLPLPLSFARRGENAKDLTNPDLLGWIQSLRAQGRALEEEIALWAAGRQPPSKTPEDPAQGTSPEVLGSPDTASKVQSLGKELSSLRRRASEAEGELHSRFTFSLACLTFPLVAFPIVVLLERQGRLLHFFLGNLAVVTVFFPLIMAGHLAVDRGFPPSLAMALPNLALAALGVPLVRSMFKR